MSFDKSATKQVTQQLQSSLPLSMNISIYWVFSCPFYIIIFLDC